MAGLEIHRKKQKPLVGIVAKPLSDFECPDDIWTECYIKDEFRDAVYRGGCLAAGILPPFHRPKYNHDESEAVLDDNLTVQEKFDLNTILQIYSGFILQGGLSGDFYELYIAKYAIQHNIPVIGVCAGFNTLARAAGCRIVSGDKLGIRADRHNVYSTSYRHTIKTSKNSTLFGIFKETELAVNSLHTQFLDFQEACRHSKSLEVEAAITDELENGAACTTVEAYRVKYTRFAMGFKWHPEIMGQAHKDKLFGRFLEECRQLGSL